MRHREPLTPEQERELEALDRALSGAPVEAHLREFDELVRDIRATAPEMSAGFAARLEHEVSEGFPSPRERPPLRGRRPARRWVLLPAAGSLAAVLVALVVVFGGGGDGGGEVADSLSSNGAAQSDQPSPASGGAERDESAAAPGGGPTSSEAAPIAGARKVQRSATLALQTSDDEFDVTTDAVNATVARLGGIVASSQVGASDARGGEATFDLRIPTDRLDRALAALSKLGHVTERSQSLDDVTAPFQSARERLTDARAERRGLLRALERAETQRRIDGLKARLRSVARRIGGLDGQLASLRRRADLATVSLTVRGGGTSASTGGGGHWTPGDAAGDAVRVLELVVGVALVGLAILVPAGLIGAGIALAARLGRRRRREAALDPA